MNPHDHVRWHCEWRIEKFLGVDLAVPRLKALWEHGQIHPDDYTGGEGNLLLTVGATDLFNGLVTAGLATPYTSTNAQIAVGDGTTAAAVGNTDLAAAAGTKINAADPSSATNATPIVVSGTFSPSAVVGSCYVLAGFTGAGGAAANNTFECSVGGASSMTLLNSAGTGSITVTGATIQPINYYRQLVSGAPSVSTNTAIFTSIFTATHGNFHWQEFGISTGGGATNKQAQAPPHLLNRKVSDNGTKASGDSWTFAITLSLA